MEQAEANFKQHSDMIVELAVNLIEQDAVNDRGHYVVTSDILG